jgi:hypothetical protein
MRVLLFLCFVFITTSGYSQHKYPGPVHEVPGNFKLDSLVTAGDVIEHFPLRMPGKDTLSNTEIRFKSSVGGISVCEVYIVICKKLVVQYQLDTFEQKNTTQLLKICEKYFGAPEKNMKGVKSAMYFWKTELSGKEIHTVLITAKGGRKGELVSWIVK